MKILIINGSPRKGNTKFALETMKSALKEKYQHATCEFVNVATLKIAGCINCDACKNNSGNCIHKDDTATYMDKMLEADVLIFGTPVYWWGMSGQLKIFIDKFYSKDGIIQESPRKKVCVLAFGANEITDIQYKLISEQFKSICDFLKWELLFSESYACFEKDDLKKNTSMTNEIIKLIEKI